MKTLKQALAKFTSFFRQSRLERDMAVEIQEQVNCARGMDAEEARYAARRQFGGVAHWGPTEVFDSIVVTG